MRVGRSLIPLLVLLSILYPLAATTPAPNGSTVPGSTYHAISFIRSFSDPGYNTLFNITRGNETSYYIMLSGYIYNIYTGERLDQHFVSFYLGQARSVYNGRFVIGSRYGGAVAIDVLTMQENLVAGYDLSGSLSFECMEYMDTRVVAVATTDYGIKVAVYDPFVLKTYLDWYHYYSYSSHHRSYMLSAFLNSSMLELVLKEYDSSRVWTAYINISSGTPSIVTAELGDLDTPLKALPWGVLYYNNTDQAYYIRYTSTNTSARILGGLTPPTMAAVWENHFYFIASDNMSRYYLVVVGEDGGASTTRLPFKPYPVRGSSAALVSLGESLLLAVYTINKTMLLYNITGNTVVDEIPFPLSITSNTALTMYTSVFSDRVFLVLRETSRYKGYAHVFEVSESRGTRIWISVGSAIAGAPFNLTATLTTLAGAPIPGAVVDFYRLDEGSWTYIGSGVTNASGVAVLPTVALVRGRILYRAVYNGSSCYVASEARRYITVTEILSSTIRIPGTVYARIPAYYTIRLLDSSGVGVPGIPVMVVVAGGNTSFIGGACVSDSYGYCYPLVTIPREGNYSIALETPDPYVAISSPPTTVHVIKLDTSGVNLTLTDVLIALARIESKLDKLGSSVKGLSSNISAYYAEALAELNETRELLERYYGILLYTEENNTRLLVSVIEGQRELERLLNATLESQARMNVSIAGRLAVIETGIYTLIARVDALISSVSVIEKGVIALNTSMGVIEARIAGVRDGVVALETGVGTINMSLSTLVELVSRTASSTDDMLRQLSTLYDTIEELRSSVSGIPDTIVSRIDGLNTSISRSLRALEGLVRGVGENVSSNSDKLDEIRSGVERCCTGGATQPAEQPTARSIISPELAYAIAAAAVAVAWLIYIVSTKVLRRG